MDLEQAMEEIFGHGFLFTLRPAKGRKALRIIRKALQEYQDQQLNPTIRWIPCSERLPEKDMSVLISAQGHRVTAYYDAVKGVFMLTETEGLFYSMSAVTHWMPLPEAPELT